MQLDTGHSVTRFGRSPDSELADGDVFVATLATGQVVRAARAFRTGERDDPPEPRFVTIGPFGGEHPGPTVFKPQALGDGPVLRLTGDVCLRPSLDVGDLQPSKEYADADLVAKVVMAEDGTFLGAVQGQGPAWATVFLNVATGEVMRSRPEGQAMVWSRWSLVMKRDGEAPTTLFEWPAGGGASP